MDPAFLGAVGNSQPQNCWTVTLQLKGKPVEFRIDTDVDMTVVPKELYDSLYQVTLQPRDLSSVQTTRYCQLRGNSRLP